MAIDRGPLTIWLTSFSNISLYAREGAVSRKSITMLVPFGSLMRIKPPLHVTTFQPKYTLQFQMKNYLRPLCILRKQWRHPQHFPRPIGCFFQLLNTDQPRLIRQLWCTPQWAPFLTVSRCFQSMKRYSINLVNNRRI